MSIRERRHDLVQTEIVAGANEVANLMGEGVGVGRALVMDDCKGLVRVGKDARGQPASLGIVNDQQATSARHWSRRAPGVEGDESDANAE